MYAGKGLSPGDRRRAPWLAHVLPRGIRNLMRVSSPEDFTDLDISEAGGSC